MIDPGNEVGREGLDWGNLVPRAFSVYKKAVLAWEPLGKPAKILQQSCSIFSRVSQ